MRRIVMSTGLLLAAAISFSLYGCNTPSSDPSPTGQATDAHADHADHGDHDHGDHAQQGAGGQTDMEKMKAELAKLSPEDAASAEKQHICPVSGEMLGTMGAPLKIDVNGQQVWICCDGCKDKLLASPDEYLAKIRPE